MKRALAAMAACLMVANLAAAQPDDRGGRRLRGFDEGGDAGEDAQGQPGGRRGRGGPGGGEFGGGPGGPGGPGGEEGGRGGFRGRGRSNPLFEAIDADGDGQLTRQELRRAAAAILTLDADDDGVVTLQEASPQRGPGGFGGPGGGFDPQAMVDRWMEGDANGDGMLSPDELPGRMGQMLGNADTNNDGLLDRAELTAAAEQMAERFGGGRGGPGGQQGGPGGGPGGFGGGGGFDAQQMTERMMAGDQNGDGVLTPDEVPPQMRQALGRADQNGDGALDAREIAQFAEQMGQRMQGRGGFGRGGGEQGGFGRGGGGEQGGGGRGGRPQRPEN